MANRLFFVLVPLALLAGCKSSAAGTSGPPGDQGTDGGGTDGGNVIGADGGGGDAANSGGGALGLPVRQFLLQDPNVPGKTYDTGAVFALDGKNDGEIFSVAVDTIRTTFSVQESDGTWSVVTSQPSVYVQPNLFESPSMRALCATDVSVIDRGAAPKGHAYSYDTTKGSRLVCWVNPSSGPKTAWQTVVVATTMGTPTPDMFWSFAMLGSRTDPSFDVAYAQDAEWRPLYFTSIGRQPRELGLEATISLVAGKATLGTIVTGEFPDFTALQSGLPNASPCQDQCGWVWQGATWYSCGSTCGGGTACIAGTCQTGTCTPLTAATLCNATTCGQFSDGCGGRVDCGNNCAAGTTCGADGTYRKCSTRLRAFTVDEVRATYGDTGLQICGTMADPATSSTVVMGPCPDPDQKCQNNLCNPLRLGPTPILDGGTD